MSSRSTIHRFVPLCLVLLATGASATAEPATQPAAGPYLFCYFKGNGEDGLHLAWSRDGYSWQALKNDQPFLPPLVGKHKLMRNPCILQDKAGIFHMVWTVSWTDFTCVGYANSRNLIDWSEQRVIPALPDEPTARNAWAPELFFDDQEGEYLLFWATTIPGRFPETDRSGDGGLNHRIYCRTTRDFQAFSARGCSSSQAST